MAVAAKATPSLHLLPGGGGGAGVGHGWGLSGTGTGRGEGMGESPETLPRALEEGKGVRSVFLTSHWPWLWAVLGGGTGCWPAGGLDK